MFTRLRDNWVYGGFLAALMLLALTPALASGWPLPLLLIWLQLPVYMLHQFEEHDDDRFSRFVNATVGGGREVLSRLDVFVINLGGVWVVDAVAFWLAARMHVGLGLIAVYLSLINGVSHVLMAAVMRRYNPGVITSLVLFIPLGVITLRVLHGSSGVSSTAHIVGLGVAVLIHAAIILLIVARKRQFG